MYGQRWVKRLLQKHSPQANVTVEQRKFFARIQQNNELITEYIAASRKLASTREFAYESCKASVSSTLLRVRFIRGVAASSLRERILCEKLAFEDAMSKALAYDASKVDAKSIANATLGPAAATQTTVNKVFHQPRSKTPDPPVQKTQNRRRLNRSKSRGADFRVLGIDKLSIKCGRDNRTKRRSAAVEI